MFQLPEYRRAYSVLKSFCRQNNPAVCSATVRTVQCHSPVSWWVRKSEVESQAQQPMWCRGRPWPVMRVLFLSAHLRQHTWEMGKIWAVSHNHEHNDITRGELHTCELVPAAVTHVPDSVSQILSCPSFQPPPVAITFLCHGHQPIAWTHKHTEYTRTHRGQQVVLAGLPGKVSGLSDHFCIWSIFQSVLLLFSVLKLRIKHKDMLRSGTTALISGWLAIVRSAD